MQNLLKFSDYDIFAYVVAGLALMVGADVVLGWDTILRRDGSLSLGEGAARVLIAYVLGLLLTAPSSWALQRLFENRIVGHPFGFLMRAGDGAAPGWRGWGVFGNYHDSAPPAVRGKVRERLLNAPGWSAKRVAMLEQPPAGWVPGTWQRASEAVFSTAHPAALRDSVASERMETFLKLYGFCRNLAFVLLLCAVGFVVQCALGTGAPQLGRASSGGSGVSVLVVPSDGTAARVADVLKPAAKPACGPFADKAAPARDCAALPSHFWMAVGSAAFAILLLLRFLYFHRLYALEVLTAYAREKVPAAGGGKPADDGTG